MKKNPALRLAVVASILSLTLVLAQCGTAFPRNAASLNATTRLSITSTGLPRGTIGSSYRATLQATGGVSPYKWSVVGGALPSGIWLQSSRGTLNGTPTKSGTYSATFAVTDNTGDVSQQTLDVSIAPSGLTIQTTSLPSGNLNQAYSAQLQVSGGTLPYTWSIQSGSLPPGLSMSGSGLISGTPTHAGVYSATFGVVDSNGLSASQTLSVTIATTSLAILTTSLPSGNVSKSYGAQLQAGGGTTPYTWSVKGGSLPPGLSLSSGGMISGTASTAGIYTATFGVADSTGQTASGSLSITIDSTTLAILTTSLPNASLNKSYSTQLQASGGGTPYTWSIIGGGLPPGLTLSSGGLISGTATATGTFTATFQVVDSTLTGAQTAMTNLSIVVVAALQITTSTLSGATVGKTYSAQLNATGGKSPYTWTVPSGSLPSGLSMASSGAISGTPDTAGTSSFTAEVTDSSGATAQKGLSIDVSSSSSNQTALYGVPWNADDLQNEDIGGPSNYKRDIRFKATHTGQAQSLRVYLNWHVISSTCSTSYSGSYACGTGGIILAQLETDDGTSNHLPSGSVLGQFTITNPLACNPGASSCLNSERDFPFDSPVSLAAGTVYHLVFSDIDPNPAANWVCLDHLYIASGAPNMQPSVSDTDLAALAKTSTGSWSLRGNTTPVFDLTYTDGAHDGQGYMWASYNYKVYGSNMVRERFVPTSGGSYSTIWVRVHRSTGSPGPVTVELLEGSSTVASGVIGSFDSKGWGAFQPSSPFTLVAGQTYYLQISAPSGDSSDYYSDNIIQKGTMYGFHAPNEFSDGYMQYSTNGSSWSNYSGSRTDMDLQFYFTPAN